MSISIERQWESYGGAFSDAILPAGPSVEQEVSWYAVQVRPRFEKKSDTLLRRKGIETFLPLLEQIHQWSDRRKRILTPLFPGYGFIHLQLSTTSRKTVLETEGIIALVGTPATRIPAFQIQFLQQLLRSHADCTIRPFLHAGQRVRIRSGALRGFEGILLEDTRKRLVVSVECIQRSVSVVIDGYDLELI